MPYYTQSRDCGGPTGAYYRDGLYLGLAPTGAPFHVQLGGLWRSTESVTSYRTGRRAHDLTPLDETEVLASNSSGQFAHYLEADYQRTARTRFDTGHTFDSKKQLYQHLTEVDWNETYLGHEYQYRGPLLPDTAFQSSTPNFRGFRSGDTNYYGAKAIQIAMPTNPLSDLAVNLAEFKSEGARLGLNAYEARIGVDNARKAGDDYLNSQFGWLPLEGAIRDTAVSLTRANEVIKNYVANSGKLIRRNVRFPDIEEETTISSGSPAGRLLIVGGPVTNFFAGSGVTGPQYQNLHSVTRYWFSGAFTYSLNLGRSVLDKLDRYEQYSNKLLGTRVTPEVMWNLAPWSWLSDWSFNIGDVIHNATLLADDGLVLAYGYLMAETIDDHTVTIVPSKTLRSGGVVGPVTTVFRTIRKQRIRANPFGFALNPSSYTARQWAILGALGLTNAPGSVRTSESFTNRPT